jgi:Cys-tRNA(Pro)/Cys-tRNA(Cys) deacylase
MVFEPVSETPVSKELDDKNITYRLFTHEGPIHSLEQAAKERNQTPDQIVGSILFRLPKDNYIMVLVAGPDQISWSDLREYLGKSRITMASKEQVLEQTGYQIGAVSPFGLPSPIRILMDEAVLNQQEVSLGSGVRGTTVFMKVYDLIQALDHPETGCFVECD